MSPTVSTTDYAAIIDRLERFADGTQDNFPGNTTDLRAVISLLREASNTEPIAWLSIDCIGERYLCFTRPQDNDPAYPLFTHPASLVLRELVDAKPDAWITEDGERVVTARETAATLTARDQVRRRWSGPGHLEQTGYIPQGSAAEREAQPQRPTTEQEAALERMAENARELGLDYEPTEVRIEYEWDTPAGVRTSPGPAPWNGRKPDRAVRWVREPESTEILKRICAESYQVVGWLADECGLFDDESVIKALDNLSDQRLVHDDVLPFSPVERPSFDNAEDLIAHLREPTEAQIEAARACMRHSLSSLPTEDADLNPIVYSVLRVAFAARG